MTKQTRPLSPAEAHEFPNSPEQKLARMSQEALIATGLRISEAAPPIEIPKTAYAAMSVTALVKYLQDLHCRTILEMSGMGLPAAAAQEHANLRWREAMPELVDRYSVQQFIALVAWGARNRVLDAAEGKMLIFLAQTQLSVLKAPQPKPDPPPSTPRSDGPLFEESEVRRP